MTNREGRRPDSAEKTVRDIRRATRRKFSAEEKIRIVLEGLRGEETIAEIAFAFGYANSSNFMRACRRWTGMMPAEFLQMRTVRSLDRQLAAASV